ITPTVAAAAEGYPELSVAEILALYEPALARDLTFELETACRQQDVPPTAGQEPGVMTCAESLMLYRIVVQMNRIQNARPAVFDQPGWQDERTRWKTAWRWPS